MKGRSFSTL